MPTLRPETPTGSILLTGASSFSGLWIAEALAAAGHRVVAPLRRREEDYSGLRLARVQRLKSIAEICFEADFTAEAFDGVVKRHGPFDLFAHHAADIANYRDPEYEVGQGVARNTERARHVFRLLKAGGAKAVIATGTTFEMDDRLPPPDDMALSPYGLSKALTNQALRHFAHWEGLAFARFVIAAPFGPWEEGRFVWSLFQAWLSDRPALVRTPAYVRDNLPAELLGKAYARLAGELMGGAGGRVARPSGFVGTQETFARKVAIEAQARLGRPCLVTAATQSTFLEPEVRVNDEPAIPDDWDEAGFWDRYVDYYLEVERAGLLQAAQA
jgi:nucleoside-diphosphate-sugar epimerase